MTHNPRKPCKTPQVTLHYKQSRRKWCTKHLMHYAKNWANRPKIVLINVGQNYLFSRLENMSNDYSHLTRVKFQRRTYGKNNLPFQTALQRQPLPFFPGWSQLSLVVHTLYDSMDSRLPSAATTFTAKIFKNTHFGYFFNQYSSNYGLQRSKNRGYKQTSRMWYLLRSQQMKRSNPNP